MKQLLTLLIVFAFAISGSVALAGDVKVKVVTSTGMEDEPTTTFATEAPKILAIFKTKGISEGDKVRGVLIAEDVGDVAAPNTKVLEKTIKLDEDTDDGDFNFSKPDKGWPAGKYRVEVYVNDELAAKAKFTIGAAEKAEKESKATDESDEAAKVPDGQKLTELVNSSVSSFGRGVKKKDFSTFYEETATIWQKQTSPEELREAFKDFFNKHLDLASAIKELQPVFNKTAKIDSNGVLLVQGYYPTTPNRILFKLKYVDEDGDWKLVGIDVNLNE